MGSTPADRLGASNGFNMLSRQMGAATASVVGATVVAAGINYVTPSGTEAFYWLFGLGGLAAFLALLLALGTSTLNPPSSLIQEPLR